MRGDPIDGQVLLLAGSTASVAPERLPDLIDHVQEDLADRLPEYERRYERVYGTDDAAYFFVEAGHWEDVGERLGFDRRETSAVERAHREQLRRIGRRIDRREEFDAAFDVRECVVISHSE
jgi:hypothetical protein